MNSSSFLSFDGQHRCTLTCQRALVGRVIGKHGTTVKGIQMFSQAIVDIDQTADEATITIQGSEEGTQVAKRMILDIIANSFKGFALLRDLVNKARNAVGNTNDSNAGEYVFCPGKGIFPRRQIYDTAATGGASAGSVGSPARTSAAIHPVESTPRGFLIDAASAASPRLYDDAQVCERLLSLLTTAYLKPAEVIWRPGGL